MVREPVYWTEVPSVRGDRPIGGHRFFDLLQSSPRARGRSGDPATAGFPFRAIAGWPRREGESWQTGCAARLAGGPQDLRSVAMVREPVYWTEVPSVRGDRPHLCLSICFWASCSPRTRGRSGDPATAGFLLRAIAGWSWTDKQKPKAGKTAVPSKWQADLTTAFRLRCCEDRCIGREFPPFAGIDLTDGQHSGVRRSVPPVRGDRPLGIFERSKMILCSTRARSRPGDPAPAGFSFRATAGCPPSWQADLRPAFRLRRCEDRCIGWQFPPFAEIDPKLAC